MIRQEIKRSGMLERGFVDKSRTDITFRRSSGIQSAKRLDESKPYLSQGTMYRTSAEGRRSHDERRLDPCPGK